MDLSSGEGGRCSCKGIRTCLECETAKQALKIRIKEAKWTYDYCVACGDKAYLRSSDTELSPHPYHNQPSILFPGVTIINDFIDETTEKDLVHNIDQFPWIDSQSGRRKQDFGPKVNFKRQKVKIGAFTGLPPFSENLMLKLKNQRELHDFEPVEQCHLEYVPERGSAIDAHFDDFWLWGKRLVTVNLLNDTVLRMSCDSEPEVEVRLPLKRRSLVILAGEARYKWKHAIHRSDVTARRLAITVRELTKDFLPGGKNESLGRELLSIAASYRGKSIGESS